ERTRGRDEENAEAVAAGREGVVAVERDGADERRDQIEDAERDRASDDQAFARARIRMIAGRNGIAVVVRHLLRTREAGILSLDVNDLLLRLPLLLRRDVFTSALLPALSIRRRRRGVHRLRCIRRRVALLLLLRACFGRNEKTSTHHRKSYP